MVVQRLSVIPAGRPPMKIVIGILAWNEENSIAQTISSLSGQTLLERTRRGDGIEIIVVPNGCTDRTPIVAGEALQKLLGQHPQAMARVEAIAEGGKSNAWNQFIHRIAPAGADLFILMDADIELIQPEALENMVSALENNPHAYISTDLPVKHLARKPRLSIKERLLLGAGSMTRSAPGQLTGQLYCARAHVLRKVWMPKGILVEDGYLKQVVCTDGYSHAVDNSRIVRAENAGHIFECYTRWRDIWNHQIRQAIGHTIYTYLTAYIRANLPERPVYDAILELSARQPDWFLDVIRATVRERGFWVMDRPSLWMRWNRVRFGKSMVQRAKFFAIAAAAFPFDLCVFWVSNQRLKNGKIKGLWKDTRTTTLAS